VDLAFSRSSFTISMWVSSPGSYPREFEIVTGDLTFRRKPPTRKSLDRKWMTSLDRK
jgi:hypothetical protein